MTEERDQGTQCGETPASETKDAPVTILQHLRQMPVFQELNDGEFKAVAGLLRIQHTPRGMLVIEQGAASHSLFIVRRGRALVRVIGTDDIERRTGQLSIGDIFNQESFLRGARNSETIEALDDLTLWFISREEFQKLLESNPGLGGRVTSQPPTEGVAEAQDIGTSQLKYSWQRPNEHVVLYSKKHVIVFLNALWPGLIALVLIAIFMLQPVAELLQQAQAVLIMATVTVFLIYVILEWVDWQNDYYAVTDQRVIHRERVLLIRDEQDEVPLSRIQDIKVERPSFLASMIDIGNITIEASGSHAKVRFVDIGKPDEVSKLLFGQLDRARLESHATMRAKIRLDLRREMGLAPPVQRPAAPSGNKLKPAVFGLRERWSIAVRQAGMFRNALMPRLRLEVGDTITYRKHWLRLLQTIAVPFLLLILYAVALLFVRISSESLSQLVFSFPFNLVVIGIGLVLLFSLAYKYEDWRNDVYIVKPDRLIDIAPSPFGLRGTSRREAKFGAVQNVTATTRGVLDNLFNVGDVVIQTAGSDGKLVFERVYNPRRIQRDIADRMDAYDAQRHEKEAAQRRKEMAEWLGIYDELTRLHERDRLL